jgi:hypothetical protein
MGHLELHAHHQSDGHLQLVQVCAGEISVKRMKMREILTSI